MVQSVLILRACAAEKRVANAVYVPELGFNKNEVVNQKQLFCFSYYKWEE